MRAATVATRQRWVRPVLAALLVVLALGGCRDSDQGSSQPGDAPPPAPPPADLADLPEESLGSPPAMRLAEGLLPPTNRWFSGLVFPEQAQPVFPSPLSFTPTTQGFDVGVPQVTTSAATIMGAAASDIRVESSTSEFLVSRYDDASLTLTLRGSEGADTGDLLDVTLAQGSPVVGLQAHGAMDLTLHARTWREFGTDGQWIATSESGRAWVLTAPAGSIASGGALKVHLDADEGAALVAAPDSRTPEPGDEIATAVAVASTRTTHSTQHGASRTTLDYLTTDGSPTLLTAAPHHGGCADPVGTYPSVRGALQACTATSLEWDAPLVEALDRLDLERLSDTERQELSDQVRTDAAQEREMPADTYFGGKALQREASLMLIAQDLGLDAEATRLRARVGEALRTWAEPLGCESREERCFTFDPLQHLVVGKAVAFGSETANDAHFHLGYFLSAAAMAGADDPVLAQDIAPVIDALAQTLGADTSSTLSPRLRTFDVYWSHSWASGWAPFADGNNQESVSEAVNAWNGLALWARLRGQSDLEERATWMLSMEAHASHTYWTDFDRTDPVYQGFDHTVASLQWGGKRDWATWFSPEPSAMLGILVIPAPPVASRLGGDPARIRDNLEEALAGASDHDVMFGDQLLMYRSLAGPDDAASALTIARGLPDERIDDGNTRSYLMAFVMSNLR
ncbi:MAG: hypothetical protein L0L69_01255 [Propionibacterium sp.]|nr:hypothetical protein [Propionibacterium sp.]